MGQRKRLSEFKGGLQDGNPGDTIVSMYAIKLCKIIRKVREVTNIITTSYDDKRHDDDDDDIVNKTTKGRASHTNGARCLFAGHSGKALLLIEITSTTSKVRLRECIFEHYLILPFVVFFTIC